MIVVVVVRVYLLPLFVQVLLTFSMELFNPPLRSPSEVQLRYQISFIATNLRINEATRKGLAGVLRALYLGTAAVATLSAHAETICAHLSTLANMGEVGPGVGLY